MAEANSRLVEMEKSHMELNTAKIRLSGRDRLFSLGEGLRLTAWFTLWIKHIQKYDVADVLPTAENSDLSRELGEAQSKLNQITRIKASLTTQNDELKRQLDEESKVKTVALNWLNCHSGSISSMTSRSWSSVRRKLTSPHRPSGPECSFHRTG